MAGYHREKIGSFDAKTHFAEVLRRVEAGESFDVTRRGEVVASIVPPLQDAEGDDKKPRYSVFDELDKLRKAMPPAKITLEEVLSWKHEGHKW